MSYWEDRQRQLNKALAKDEENLKKRLSKIYDAEARRLEKEIANYYQQYGRENVIEYRRLMEALPDSDKVLLIEKMDKFAEKFPEYSHLMPVRESIYKLDRIQGLQYSVIMQQLEIGAEENELIRKHLEQTASRSLETAAETMGFGSSFYAMNKYIVKTFVDVPWSNGAKFSDTIWKNKAKLYNYLNTDLAQGFARGDSYDRLAKQIRERFGKVSRNDAYRLIYTEGTYVQAEASMQPFTEDFEKYRISTVGDNKVCPICEAMAQEVFEIKDRTPGENFPPFHPWCRCTFIVVVDDWDAWKRDYMAKHGGDQAEADEIEHRINVPMSSKMSTERDSFKKLTDRQLDQLLIPVKKLGAIIKKGTPEAIRHLDSVDSAASVVGDVIFFREEVTISEALEEMHHFNQNRQKLNFDKDVRLMSILNEIDAKEYLLSVQKKYNIPRDEIDFTKRQLESYKKELEEYYAGQ